MNLTESSPELQQISSPIVSATNQQSFYQHLDYDLGDLVLTQNQDGFGSVLRPQEHLIYPNKFVTLNLDTREQESMLLSYYRIIVQKDNGNNVVSIPYGYIQEIQKGKSLKLTLKTGISFQFWLRNCSEINKLQEYIQAGISLMPFCLKMLSDEEQPNIYDSQAEIERMRVDSHQYCILKNENRQLCATYPLIPKGVQPSNLHEVKKCRYSSRIPAMSYFNQKSNSGLWRAAKRKEEVNQSILKFDISYIREIPGNSITLTIQDSILNKGNLNFQSLSALKNSFFQFNRAYFQMLTKPQTVRAQFYKALFKWYEDIDKIISLAYYCVDLMNQSHHVIVEQNFAYDRTTQVLVIAEIVMDPFFRTFDGLAILLQKQFMAYGFPFEDRCGFNKNKQYQVSPIFIQTLECLHQLVVTHPEHFQYSSAYLAKIAYEVYSTKYKNFINRIDDPKKQKSYQMCTETIWRQSLRERNHYNYRYAKKQKSKKQLWEVRKKPSVKQYVLWVDYYDLICKMDEKEVKGKAFKEASQLREFWRRNKKS